MVNNGLPVERKLEVAQALADDSGDVILLRQQHGAGNCDPELGRQRIIEKLVIGRPPKGIIDDDRFEQVKMLLIIQEKEAVWWRNACVLYFQTFSKMPIPKSLEQPDKSLEYYDSLQFPYAPGIGGNQ